MSYLSRTLIHPQVEARLGSPDAAAGTNRVNWPILVDDHLIQYPFFLARTSIPNDNNNWYSPLNPPGLIKINKVSTEHDFTDTLSSLPTHTTNPWFPDDPPSGDPGRHDVVDAAILVTWSAAPPEDGLMIAYRVYLTRNIYQNNAQWKEHIVPGDQNST
ncbi:unnamed protein product, partial [Dibothriocephalus latus]